ncbi:MAG: hypothetical protein K0Q73_581 [Paenibacillus sp.]|nr:hypothetical protein [Paenibacillus sp.]
MLLNLAKFNIRRLKVARESTEMIVREYHMLDFHYLDLPLKNIFNLRSNDIS